MSYKVGMPILKLKRGGGRGRTSGNAKAVAMEALAERYSSDPDINRARTKDNLYEGFTHGVALNKFWVEMANAHRVVNKHGKERKLRFDANIGLAQIIKPDAELMSELSPDEQVRFLRDAIEVTKNIYKSFGVECDSAVIQLDELTPHAHLFLRDPEYKLGDKVNRTLYNRLNHQFPADMRQLGWKVKDCDAWVKERDENGKWVKRKAKSDPKTNAPILDKKGQKIIDETSPAVPRDNRKTAREYKVSQTATKLVKLADFMEKDEKERQRKQARLDARASALDKFADKLSAQEQAQESVRSENEALRRENEALKRQLQSAKAEQKAPAREVEVRQQASKPVFTQSSQKKKANELPPDVWQGESSQEESWRGLGR